MATVNAQATGKMCPNYRKQVGGEGWDGNRNLVEA